MTRCAVLGDPIEHSLSPVLHTAAYEALGLDGWTYGAERVDEAGLRGFVDRVRAETGWRGLSLTMPLKRTVVPMLDEMGPTAALAGAANTVVLDGGRLLGENTDVPGAVAALRERHDGPLRSAVVLGGGATAASVLLALAELGCERAVVAVRDPSRVGDTLDAVARHPRAPALDVQRLDEVAGHGADVVVSTIPAAAQHDDLLGRVAEVPVVFEVVYDPWPTPLARQALDLGRTLVGGLDLLVHQAARQVELMTGHPDAPVAAMRAAGESALLARAGRSGH